MALKLFDLHCDTLTECFRTGKSLIRNDLHLDIRRGLGFERWVQCFAVWIPDEVRGDEAISLFEGAADLLEREAARCPALRLIRSSADLDALRPGECGAVLTVESGAAAAGSLERLSGMVRRGVRMMTLTWNGENELGGGVRAPGPLTPFGREAVREMERLGVIIDLSHASERLFYAVAEETSGPLAASHSDARALCPHPRNLTDEQFCLIRDRGGLVGLNFAPPFLSKGKARRGDVWRHAEHFLALGGENVLAMGSDFDGTDLPEDLRGVGDMEALCEDFLRHGCPEDVVRRIFFENAYNFFHSL